MLILDLKELNYLKKEGKEKKETKKGINTGPSMT